MAGLCMNRDLQVDRQVATTRSVMTNGLFLLPPLPVSLAKSGEAGNMFL
jgi:hypothetical protein